MRSIGYLATVAFLLMTVPAAAEFVNEEWDDGDLGNWQAITGDQFIEVLDEGGMGDSGYLHTYQTSPTFGISGAVQRFAPYIGDYGARGYIVVRCDLLFVSGVFESVDFRVRYQSSNFNGWYLPLTTDFSTGAWRHFAFEFDPDWSDGEAMAAGWVQEATTPTFQETMADVYTAEIRIQGDNLLEVGIDNFQLDDDLIGTEAASWGQVKALFR